MFFAKTESRKGVNRPYPIILENNIIKINI